MSRFRTCLGQMLVAAVLVACGDYAPLMPPAESAPLLGKGGSSQGLTRMAFPADFPGVPAYGRIDLVPPHVYVVDGWAVIAFYRDPDCVRPDFNLLEFFDVPAAFGCALTVEGFALYEPGVFPGAPKISSMQGSGAVPFWFVPEEALVAAVENGELFIGELEALPGRLVGYATHFTEVLQPSSDPVFGGGHPNPKLIQTAHGSLEDGRRFQYHLTEIDGEVKSISLRFK